MCITSREVGISHRFFVFFLNLEHYFIWFVHIAFPVTFLHQPRTYLQHFANVPEIIPQIQIKDLSYAQMSNAFFIIFILSFARRFFLSVKKTLPRKNISDILVKREQYGLEFGTRKPLPDSKTLKRVTTLSLLLKLTPVEVPFTYDSLKVRHWTCTFKGETTEIYLMNSRNARMQEVTFAAINSTISVETKRD